MKSKLLFLIGLCCFCTTTFSANQHMHPQATSPAAEQQQAASTGMKWPGYCEVEIINQSFDDVRIYGVFDDGSPLEPFNIYSYESPHYVSLYYYGYCHAGMDFDIVSLTGGYHIYSGYTRTHNTIRILPYFVNQAHVSVQPR